MLVFMYLRSLPEYKIVQFFQASKKRKLCRLKTVFCRILSFKFKDKTIHFTQWLLVEPRFTTTASQAIYRVKNCLKMFLLK